VRRKGNRPYGRGSQGGVSRDEGILSSQLEVHAGVRRGLARRSICASAPQSDLAQDITDPKVLPARYDLTEEGVGAAGQSAVARVPGLSHPGVFLPGKALAL
jgi:hypothetical protein